MRLGYCISMERFWNGFTTFMLLFPPESRCRIALFCFKLKGEPLYVWATTDVNSRKVLAVNVS